MNLNYDNLYYTIIRVLNHLNIFKWLNKIKYRCVYYHVGVHKPKKFNFIICKKFHTFLKVNTIQCIHISVSIVTTNRTL